jgi:UDP-N-acetylglucosamine--N-acetylmuramyl-(pentapeptide) pyrophosphoryl-undecaprenol N-acetylglucosamine transferase
MFGIAGIIRGENQLRGESCICFTGGGTGGHVFPGIAVIRELKKTYSGRIVWIGSNKGMERDIVSSESIPFHGVPCGKLRRYLSVENCLDFFKVIAGFFASVFLLIKEQPLLVFSKGGYVSVPVVAAAGVLRIPVFTHESDFDPGIATRINSIFAEKILTSFVETISFFSEKYKPRIVFTGNPIRTELLNGNAELGKKLAGCPPARKVLLVLGGSQGAKQINDAIRKKIDQLCELSFVIHQTGKKDFIPSTVEGYFAAPFFKEELSDILASASIVVSRAGSNTLWELAALGIPSVLVPLASGSRGDQVRNAKVFEKSNASIVVEEGEGLDERLLEIIRKVINNEETLKTMSVEALSLARKEASRMIALMIRNRMRA